MKIVDLSEQNTILNRFISEIRDVKIQQDRLRFRRNIERVGEIMAYEISKTLKYKKLQTKTPLGINETNVPADPIVVGTILRAGLIFHQGFIGYFDGAESAFVSAFRQYKENHKSFHIHIEYIASPSLDKKVLILADPMLATGGSMELAYKALQTKGEPSHIHIATVIASKQAIEYCAEHFPKDKTTLWAAAVDPELDDHSYIVPGLGDAGDLAYGPKDESY